MSVSVSSIGTGILPKWLQVLLHNDSTSQTSCHRVSDPMEQFRLNSSASQFQHSNNCWRQSCPTTSGRTEEAESAQHELVRKERPKKRWPPQLHFLLRTPTCHWYNRCFMAVLLMYLVIRSNRECESRSYSEIQQSQWRPELSLCNKSNNAFKPK